MFAWGVLAKPWHFSISFCVTVLVVLQRSSKRDDDVTSLIYSPSRHFLVTQGLLYLRLF